MFESVYLVFLSTSCSRHSTAVSISLEGLTTYLSQQALEGTPGKQSRYHQVRAWTPNAWPNSQLCHLLAMPLSSYL